MFLIGTNPEINQYIFWQTHEDATILTQLRQLLQQLLLEATEKIAYKLPFFYQNGRLCYFRPPVELVYWRFCQGLKFLMGRVRVLYNCYDQAGQVVEHLWVPKRTNELYENAFQVLGAAWTDPMTHDEIREFVYAAVNSNGQLQSKKKPATQTKPQDK